MSNVKLLLGDSLQMLKTLPSESVHCCVTSPLYWGLRAYSAGSDEIGSEESLFEHIDKLTAVFSEVFRVLHPTGTLWFNYGDVYATHAGSARCPGKSNFGYQKKAIELGAYPMMQANRRPIDGIKRKELIGLPWMLAFAFRKAGWYLRARNIWHKTNGKPSSVIDRPSSVDEDVFLFSKRPHYFYDEDAVREKTGNEATWEEWINADGRYHFHDDDEGRGLQQYNPGFKALTHPLGRKLRTVWSIPCERFSAKEIDPSFDFDHFATFPKRIPEIAIKAGTSEKGCCPKCLAPQERQYETYSVQYDGGSRKLADAPGAVLSDKSMLRTGRRKVRKPIGWQPSCKCDAGSISCTVLDPFSGSGTTGLVACRVGRDYIGIELNEKYLELSELRIRKDLPLFNNVERSLA